jgi:replicative DNA helicase
MENLNYEIEKAVLSSVLFNPDEFERVNKVLKADDFFSSAHQKIFEVMQKLYNEEMPIVEEFIVKRLKSFKLDDVMIDILSVNPITNSLTYAKEIKKDSLTRQIQQLSSRLQHQFDISIIDKITTLKNELENLKSLKELKEINEITSLLQKYDLNFSKVENVKFEYLIENLIVKEEITMIAARPAIGKSLTTFAFVNMILLDKRVSKVIYLDGDNGLTTLKERKVHVVKERHGEKLIYLQGLKPTEFIEIIKNLEKTNLKDNLIVFDSIKNFMLGGDRDKNRDVSKVMELLKTLRNNGSSIIFLHHSNKPSKDIDELMYAGSSAWEEDSTNAFILKNNKDKKAFIFVPIKIRAGNLKESAFSYCEYSHALNHIDLDAAKETKEDVEIRNEIIDFISNSRTEPSYSQILNHLMENGYPKMKSNDVIKAGKDKFWYSKKLKQFNKTIFFLFDSMQNSTNKPIEIVFEDKVLKAS